MNWRNEPITEAQIGAIYNISSALGVKSEYPKTKGEASDLIKKLSGYVTNNLQVTGYINPSRSTPVFNGDSDFDDDYEDEYLNDVF